MRSLTPVLPLALAMVVFSSSTPDARADGAPSSVDSDLIPHKFDLDLKYKKSEIETRKYQLNLAVGQGAHSARGATTRLEAAAGTKFLLGRNVGSSVGMQLSPSAQVKLDASKDPAAGSDEFRLRNSRFQFGGATFLTYSKNDLEPETFAKSEPDPEFWARVDRDMRTGEMQNWGPCTSSVEACQAQLPEALRSASSKAQNEWFDANHIRYTVETRADRKPSFTLSVNLATGSYVLEKQGDVKARLSGVDIKWIEGAFHKSFSLRGLPIDICGQASYGVMAVLNSDRRIADRRANGALDSIQARGCVGVQLGKAGRLGYDYQISARGLEDDQPSIVNQSHELSLRKIGGTPLSVAASYERADAKAPRKNAPDGSVASPAAAAATDAKFIKIGGEF